MWLHADQIRWPVQFCKSRIKPDRKISIFSKRRFKSVSDAFALRLSKLHVWYRRWVYFLWCAHFQHKTNKWCTDVDYDIHYWRCILDCQNVGLIIHYRGGRNTHLRARSISWRSHYILPYSYWHLHRYCHRALWFDSFGWVYVYAILKAI
jgi:hypothetical protein